MRTPRSIFLLDQNRFSLVYSPSILAKIHRLTENDGQIHTKEMILTNAADYRDVEIVFSGWGAPEFSEDLLAALPELKALFYAAGTVRTLVTDAFWNRQILLTSSFAANAVPVAEFTVASIVFSLKKAWSYSRMLSRGVARNKNAELGIGVYHGARVGIVSLGAIGQRVCEMLQRYDLDVVAYDPFADARLFDELGVQKVDTLEEIFESCAIVSLHAPSLPETRGMISKELLSSLPQGATFINTARGAIVDEEGMIEVLRERKDIFAVLDVIEKDDFEHSPLAHMENVFLTPHIAGSLGAECERMAAMAVDECRRYLIGEPPLSPVTEESMRLMA